MHIYICIYTYIVTRKYDNLIHLPVCWVKPVATISPSAEYSSKHNFQNS